MKYSYNWLQKHIAEKLPSPEVLKEKIIFHAFEVESIEEYNGDSIFDIKVLPDRAGDCLSHFGMAREIAGLFKYTLKKNEVPPLPEKLLELPLEIKSDFCRRYIAVQIDGVTVGPSPLWLREALESVGNRSINNIVDATNYILLDTGQPTHAFDRHKIDGGIIVRAAHERETIITLSEEKKTLKESMLVIADYVGALALAGVKGGKTAEVTAPITGTETTSIILEIANFDPVSVRKTSRSLGLVTNASKRFENNLTPALAHSAAQQLVALITVIAGGSVVGVADRYPTPVVSRTLTFAHTAITRVLGATVTPFMIEDVFDAYKYQYTKNDVSEITFTLTIPEYRMDIIGAHDIAEEIGRVIGYSTIPAHPLPFTPALELHPVYESIRAVKYYLVEKGFSEVMTYTFRKKGEVYVAYGGKDKSALRTNLSEGLKESFDLNRMHAPLLNRTTIKLFEVGTVFFKEKEEIYVAINDNGAIQEMSLEAFIAEYHIDRIQKSFPLPVNTTPIFKSWATYPFIVRDIAMWIEESVDMSLFLHTLEAFAEKNCIQQPYLIDTFVKEGRQSRTYRLIFQEMDRTMTNEEVNILMSELERGLIHIQGIELRQ